MTYVSVSSVPDECFDFFSHKYSPIRIYPNTYGLVLILHMALQYPNEFRTTTNSGAILPLVGASASFLYNFR